MFEPWPSFERILPRAMAHIWLFKRKGCKHIANSIKSQKNPTPRSTCCCQYSLWAVQCVWCWCMFVRRSIYFLHSLKSYSALPLDYRNKWLLLKYILITKKCLTESKHTFTLILSPNDTPTSLLLQHVLSNTSEPHLREKAGKVRINCSPVCLSKGGVCGQAVPHCHDYSSKDSSC